jgi:hypothetical protein
MNDDADLIVSRLYHLHLCTFVCVMSSHACDRPPSICHPTASTCHPTASTCHPIHMLFHPRDIPFTCHPELHVCSHPQVITFLCLHNKRAPDLVLH